MTCAELLMEIECLRAKMNSLGADRAAYAEMLEVSQVLDKLIVEYYKATA